MQSPPRVLSFGAHPDDTEFRCAGTLALLKRAGWEIGIATVTGGEGGSRRYGPSEIHDIRIGECREAAKIIGAEYYYAGGTDMDVDFSHELRVKVVHVLRQFRPDVVITLPPRDYHTDHEETSRLVRAACFFAPIPNYPEQTLDPIETVPYLYYSYAGKDILGNPAPVHFWVDITPVRGIKEKMVSCHRSQADWILSHHGTEDYMRALREEDARRGQRVGVSAAEGFCQHLGPGYPHDNVISEALGERGTGRGR